MAALIRMLFLCAGVAEVALLLSLTDWVAAPLAISVLGELLSWLARLFSI
jgi:hypothetical protein